MSVAVAAPDAIFLYHESLTMTEVTTATNVIPSVRLTKYDRDAIRNDLLKHKFITNSTVIEDLRVERIELVNDIINSVVTPEMKKRIDDLPNGWLPETEYVQVKFSEGKWDGYQHIHLNGSDLISYRLRKLLTMSRIDNLPPVSIRLPYNYNNGALAVYNVRHPFAIRWQDHTNKVDAFADEVSNVAAMINGILSSVTTTKKLAEVWPEAKPFILARYGTEAQKPRLPVVIIETTTLNEKLGLPVE